MKLLIVGSTGQLGTDLARAAADAGGIEVEPLGRPAIDLEDLDGIAAALDGHRADIVVNCAAYNDTARAESEPGAAIRVNGYAPERLAESARRMGARFVQIGTDYVFDGRADRPYLESDPPAPLSVYGASKLMGEALARRAYPDGTIVVRTAALFGLAGQRTGNFVETILKVAERDEPVRLVSDITTTPTATADLAVGLLGLLEADPPPGVYHMVSGGRATWLEFGTAILEEAGIDAEVRAVPASEFASVVRRPAFSVLDPGRAAALAGALPHWRDGLRRYLAERNEGRPGRADTELASP